MSFETSLLDYELPESLIAQDPLENRAASRLLVMSRENETLEHSEFSQIGNWLREGDLLVVNNSRVFPARLFVKKETGANIELLFLRDTGGGKWEALARPGRRLKEGVELFHESGDEAFCRVSKKCEGGMWLVDVRPDPLFPFLEKYGVTPLPPYIKNKIDDPERYQTVYARETGSTAAPTAGLHFTGDLLDSIAARGIETAPVTLHIGIDTFRPIGTDTLEEHDMHTEIYTVPDETAAKVSAAKERGGRVVAVGTTAVRSLESWAAAFEKGVPEKDPPGASGATNLFIYRREQFRVIDAMITNFHLPRTTLLALVCAFAGRDFALRAYREATENKYRFFSFGDATFIY